MEPQNPKIEDVLKCLDDFFLKKDYKSSILYLLNLAAQPSDVNRIISYMESTDFFESPASNKYHDSEPQGLVKHTLRVCYWILRYIIFIDKPDLLKDAILSALFHDFCKINKYDKTKLWRKDEKDKWESYEGYSVKPEYDGLGHSPESVRRMIFLLPRTSFAVQQAVYSHMGLFDGCVSVPEFSRMYKTNPLVLAVVTADMLSVSNPEVLP